MPKPKYPEILTTPIETEYGLLTDKADAKHQINEQFRERLEVLFKHYGAELGAPGSEMRVIVGLAWDHLKGFSPKQRGPGRSKRWDLSGLWGLYADIRALQQRRGMSDRSACFDLAQNNTRYHDVSGKTLYNVFGVFKGTVWYDLFEEYREDEDNPAFGTLIRNYASSPKTP
jgi:hypothetical protein